jgi:hypothetical protein
MDRIGIRGMRQRANELGGTFTARARSWRRCPARVRSVEPN